MSSYSYNTFFALSLLAATALTGCGTDSVTLQSVSTSNSSVIDTQAVDNSFVGESGVSTVTSNPVEISTPVVEKSAPEANPDFVSTTKNANVVIPVLENDNSPDAEIVRLDIISWPNAGELVVEANGSVIYSPHAGFEGSDSFVYQIEDENGEIASALVDIRVSCDAQAGECSYPVRLSWSIEKSDDVTGYYVYHGLNSGDYPDRHWVPNLETVFEIELADLGSHFFAVTVVDKDGQESGYSKEAIIVL
ncbi:Ig-like domain-containing protein [Candidatus Endoriftia persephone]|jgi:hypothetical protein|nr:Ig-like domain-containing protein [Candidatus Endoriftia persephone]USF88841.1 Ig-like domain-containing protein [Candidatus Endoriftia persephone]